MSQDYPDIQIGGLVIPYLGRLELQQTYDPLERQADQRAANGDGIRWRLWGGKLQTLINGVGFAPPGLADLDTSSALLVRCAVPRNVVGPSNVLQLPAMRRTGGIYDPTGYAAGGDEWIATPLALAGDEATLTPVSGAEQYIATYYPEFTALVTWSSDTLSTNVNRYSWQILAEEQ